MQYKPSPIKSAQILFDIQLVQWVLYFLFQISLLKFLYKIINLNEFSAIRLTISRLQITRFTVL